MAEILINVFFHGRLAERIPPLQWVDMRYAYFTDDFSLTPDGCPEPGRDCCSGQKMFK